MMLVKTTIGPSPLHGIGIFAAEFIAKDTIIWSFQPGFDLRLSRQQIEQLAPPAREQTLRYCYADGDDHILCGDDARFFNWSETPNCTTDDLQRYTIAARDIAVGEELTEDYIELEEDGLTVHRYFYDPKVVQQRR